MAVLSADLRRVRGRVLQLLILLNFAVNSPYIYLMHAPTERAFSAAGILCTKIRSRLSDATLEWIPCASCAGCSYIGYHTR